MANARITDEMVEAGAKAAFDVWWADRGAGYAISWLSTKQQWCEQARACLAAALSQSEAEGWRTMDSAPKDGSRFFAYTKDGGVDFFHWQQLEYREAPVGWRDSFIQVYREDDPEGPQGWMPVPIPAAPLTVEEDNG